MYRLRPNIEISNEISMEKGYQNVVKKILKKDSSGTMRIAIETYPGVDKQPFIDEMEKQGQLSSIVDSDLLYKSEEEIFSQIQSDLTDDESFGRFSHRNFEDFFDFEKIKNIPELIDDSKDVVVIGVGAAELIEWNRLVYVDISRWEVQLRYKKGLGNWQGYKEENFAEKLKRAYYFDWPTGDYRRRQLLSKSSLYVDAIDHSEPKMVETTDLSTILKKFTTRPFRLVPYFDPGIWGGTWMQENFEVGQEKPNLAWSFDGVPEENSIIALIDQVELEMPAQILVDSYPRELLGERVFGRYGRDFPIRFDYLDTMDGQNLSLQVHPTLDYAYRNFGAKYTQDESYYILDCKDDAGVYLGLKEGITKERFVNALEKAQSTGKFEDTKFVNRFSAKKHDHFLIPAGTVHSSGKNCVVLEISATPNRFTFKLWDWGRVDMDGKPRPIAIQHGKHVINQEIDKEFAEKELINAIEVLTDEDGFKEEHTGLHPLEAIETRRLTFAKKITQKTCGSVNMMNLVEGKHIFVSSPNEEFAPFDVYYGETFIVPETIKEFCLEPAESGEIVKVMKAYIR